MGDFESHPRKVEVMHPEPLVWLEVEKKINDLRDGEVLSLSHCMAIVCLGEVKILVDPVAGDGNQTYRWWSRGGYGQNQ